MNLNLTKNTLRFTKKFKFCRYLCQQRTEGQTREELTFVYPKYVSPFKVDINRNYSEWMDRYCSQWAVDNSGPMGRLDRYRNSIRKSDCGLFSAVTYPSADWHRIEKLMKWSLIFFICDDYHDMCVEQKDQEIQVKPFWDQMTYALDSLRDTNECPDMTGWPEFVRAVIQILREIYFDYTPTQTERSIKMIKDYIEGNVEESQWTTDRNQLPDWDTYWKARLGSVGGQMALQFIEYSKNIKLSDKEWNDPSLQELIRLVSEEIILVNDYYTFRKEVVENDGNWRQMKHSFPILVKEGLTLQEAVDRVNQLIKGKDTEIMSSMRKLNDSCDSNDLNQYLDGVNQFVGGYWRHAVTARRYHGLDFKGVIPLAGRFVFDPNRTIIDGSKGESCPQWLTTIPQNVQPTS